MQGKRTRVVLAALGVAALITAGCAAGSNRFTTGDAGFWAGLWHGFICCVTFIISLFNENVRIYEIRNTGHLYDLGFVLGALIGLGGVLKPCGRIRSRKRRLADRDRDEIARKVEARVRRAIKSWADGSSEDDEWDGIGREIEEGIKEELRKWADS
jgi:hypothetical protein